MEFDGFGRCEGRREESGLGGLVTSGGQTVDSRGEASVVRTCESCELLEKVSPIEVTGSRCWQALYTLFLECWNYFDDCRHLGCVSFIEKACYGRGLYQLPPHSVLLALWANQL